MNPFSQQIKDIWAGAKRHPVISIVFAIVVGFVIFYFYNRNKQQTAAMNTANQQSPGGYTIVNEYYQAAPVGSKPDHPVPMIPPGPGGVNPTPPTTPTPTPTTPTPITNRSGALIPFGQWPSNVPWQFGKTITYGGITYTIGPGNNKRVWGVPGTGYTLQQWNQIPLSNAGGSKVLLYQG